MPTAALCLPCDPRLTQRPWHLACLTGLVCLTGLFLPSAHAMSPPMPYCPDPGPRVTVDMLWQRLQDEGQQACALQVLGTRPAALVLPLVAESLAREPRSADLRKRPAGGFTTEERQRRQAYDLVERLGERAAPLLSQLMRDWRADAGPGHASDEDRGSDASRALVALGPAAVPALPEVIRRHRQRHRPTDLALIASIGRHAPRQAWLYLDELIRAPAGPSTLGLAEAIDTVGTADADGALPRLLTLLTLTLERGRHAEDLIRRLAWKGPSAQAALPLLHSLMQGGDSRATRPDLRRWAIDAYGAIASTEQLMAWLEHGPLDAERARVLQGLFRRQDGGETLDLAIARALIEPGTQGEKLRALIQQSRDEAVAHWIADALARPALQGAPQVALLGVLAALDDERRCTILEQFDVYFRPPPSTLSHRQLRAWQVLLLQLEERLAVNIPYSDASGELRGRLATMATDSALPPGTRRAAQVLQAKSAFRPRDLPYTGVASRP